MRNRWIWIVPVLAFVFYGLALRRFFVGYLGDDARDILASLALSKGAYRNLQIPDFPPLTFPLPGFPLLLIPFSTALQPHWEWMRVVPLLATVSAIGLTIRLFRPALEWQELVIVSALFAFNPLTVAISGWVISDSFYLAGILLTLLCLQRELARPRLAQRVTLGVLVAWTSMIRPEGLVFVFALVLSLTWGKRRPLALLIACSSFGSWLIFAGRNLWLSGETSGYDAIWVDGLSFLAKGYPQFAGHLMALIQKFVGEMILAYPIHGGNFQNASMGIGLSALFILVGRGFYFSDKDQKMDSILNATMAFYLIFHLWLHMAWPASHAHYFWPLLPFLLFFIAKARLPRVLLIGMALLLGISYGNQAMAVWRNVQNPARDQQCPTQTFDWVRHNTPSSSFILAPDASVVTLYTGRFSTVLIGARNADDFLIQLKQHHMTYVLLAHVEFMYVQAAAGRRPQSAWEHIRETVHQRPKSYRLLFESKDEQRELFQVIY